MTGAVAVWGAAACTWLRALLAGGARWAASQWQDALSMWCSFKLTMYSLVLGMLTTGL